MGHSITSASRNFGRQSDRNLDTQHKNQKTRLLVYSMTTNIVQIITHYILKWVPRILDHGKGYPPHNWWRCTES